MRQVKIDLNTAAAAELDAVPALKGHGYEIVRYREDRGGFTEIRQLEEVPGLAGGWAEAEPALQVGGGETLHPVRPDDSA